MVKSGQLFNKKKDTKKKPYKPSMAKKTIYAGTPGRKNKVLQRPIDFKGINKGPIVGKSPVSYLINLFLIGPELVDHVGQLEDPPRGVHRN